MAYTFNGSTQTISLSAGTTELDVRRLWSAYVNWVNAGNGFWGLAMDTIGGDDINPNAGTKIPCYLFLLKGWDILVDDADHTLRVTNGVLLRHDYTDPFQDRPGRTVRILYEQPVQMVAYNAGGVDEEVESGVTLAHALQYLLAASVGKASGGGGTSIVFRDTGDTKDRVVLTVDESGDRSAVTLDPD
jgi:hypothetical protein